MSPSRTSGISLPRAITEDRKLPGLLAAADAMTMEARLRPLIGAKERVCPRKLAMADARHRAEILAEAGSAKLGGVLRIDEGRAPGGPMPHAGRMSAMASSTPVSKGQLSFEISVRVVYALEP